MDKYEYFEFRYSKSNDRCIEEMGELPELYDDYQMKNMCEYFFDIGFDMRSNKFKELEQQLKEANKVIGVYADSEHDYHVEKYDEKTKRYIMKNIVQASKLAKNYLTKYKVKE